ncbi:MAG: toll/interleukin-1 receptor domain-containing protein, partial [Anaerolinea sp.]|nr:toll/interleukin-1 receptor domain-containing protein [Anaerolinea sp.]
MTDQRVFISYSRKEFYFAEQLATLLKAKHGINAWFDIHELQAGMDWSAAIQAALTGCDALVLVASKASLGSPWVRVEWEPTLKAGKPVVVAFFERVELPPELHDVPRIDLRGDFEHGVERLAHGLRGENMVSDPPPRGLRFPPAVWIVIAAYLSPLLLLPVLPGLAVALLLPLLYLLRQFLRRAYTVAEQRNAFLVLIVGVLLIALITVFNQNMYEFQVTPHVPLILTSSAVILLMLTARQLLGRHPALYRWSPTGEGGQSVRERVNREVRQAQGLQFSDLGKTFRLQFDPGDQQVASDVRQALEGAHYREVQGGVIPDHEIVVVSDRTPATLLENAGEGQREVITVVATAFKVPESAKNLSRYQWIDYRKRSPEALRNMVEDMYLRDIGGANLQYALMPVPENFTAVRLPQRTDLLVQAFNIIGVLNALGAGFTLLTIGNTPPTDMFGNPIPYNPM